MQQPPFFGDLSTDCSLIQNTVSNCKFAAAKIFHQSLDKIIFEIYNNNRKRQSVERLAIYGLKVSRYIWRCGRLTCFYMEKYKK